MTYISGALAAPQSINFALNRLHSRVVMVHVLDQDVISIRSNDVFRCFRVLSEPMLVLSDIQSAVLFEESELFKVLIPSVGPIKHIEYEYRDNVQGAIQFVFIKAVLELKSALE